MSTTAYSLVPIPTQLYYTCTQELKTNRRFKGIGYEVIIRPTGYYIAFDRRIDALSFAYLWDLTLE
jgi:hypothetical protein